MFFVQIERVGAQIRVFLADYQLMLFLDLHNEEDYGKSNKLVSRTSLSQHRSLLISQLSNNMYASFLLVKTVHQFIFPILSYYSTVVLLQLIMHLKN